MKHLTPYLMFNGDCEEAVNFYKECFDGELGYMGRYGDSPMEVPQAQQAKIMHVEFKFWGGSIMASDHMDCAGYTTKSGDSNIHLSLGFDSIEKMHKTFDLLKRDGTVTMKLQEQFWGDTFGMLTDKFGIKWMFSCNGCKMD
ncbi:MAG: VOC family protein [Calditrichaeota bacterium]|nr:MAG: VOC family protein [Calditrichota bacterium]